MKPRECAKVHSHTYLVSVRLGWQVKGYLDAGGECSMKRKIATVLILLMLALGTAAPAFAKVPPPPGHKQQGGQQGYEGQPGNQSSGGH